MLTPQQYELAKQLQINVSQLVKSHFLGNYKSAFKGQGITFADMRPYTEGDPEKNIDRITTAKKGELYVKEFEEERQLKLFFLIDTGKTMHFHSTEKTKIQIAHDITLSMAYAAHQNGDQIGGANYTTDIQEHIPTSKKKLNLYKLSSIMKSDEKNESRLRDGQAGGKKLKMHKSSDFIGSSSNFKNEHNISAISHALQTLISYKINNHLLIIISDDFLTQKHPLLTQLAQHNELLYINIFDPFEKNLEYSQTQEVLDKNISGFSEASEYSQTPYIKILQKNNKITEIALTQKTKKQYIEIFKEKQKQTEHAIRSLGGDYLMLTTKDDPIRKLMGLFHQRTIRK